MLGFVILLIPGCVVSYGTTIFLLPVSALFVAASDGVQGLPAGWIGKATVPIPARLGLLLGAHMFVHMTAMFPLAGLITAGRYWWLVTQRRGATR